MLCCSESRDLPFLLKYVPLNGSSSWRQWLNMKDRQVGMDKVGVAGEGCGWTPPAAVDVLQPCIQEVEWFKGSAKICPCASTDRATWIS